MSVLQDLENLIVPVEKLNVDGVPSASLAILEDGKISAHLIANGKENHDTVYQACSISKAITGLAVAKLVDEGRLSYDTKVIDHLSKTTIDCFVDEKTAHLFQHVTVGMLLSHTSGLSQHGFAGYTDEVPSAEDVLAGKYPSNSPKVHFVSFPGARFSYSGGGYTVLQLFLENLTKTSFPDLMQTAVLKPLGMKRSWYGDLPPGENNFANAYHTGYTEAGHNHFVELAAAGLWTTPTDLLKAVAAIQASLYTDEGFISQATAKKMLTLVIEDSFLTNMGMSMGLGWAVNEKVFSHSGSNVPGYNTFVFGFHGGIVGSDGSAGDSKSRNGFAIMTNSELGHQVAVKQIISAILYLKGWERLKKLPSLFVSDCFMPYAAPESTKVIEGWREWIGKWEGGWKIVDDDGPAVSFHSFPPMRLKPAASPPSETKEGKQDLVFVVDGLKLGLRLTWEDESQVVQLLQDESKTLKRE